MNDGEFLSYLGTDATIWAKEFVKRFPEANLDPTPGNTLHGWFCNAIEAGRSAGYSEIRRLIEKSESVAIPASDTPPPRRERPVRRKRSNGKS